MHDVFFFTDVHGMYDLYRAVMKHCEQEDPEAMIVFGGDACDRGRDGYKIMKELLDNPKVVYLKGNHEDMFVHAAWFIKRDFIGEINDDNVWRYLYVNEVRDYGPPEIQNSLYNGGWNTLYDWMMDGMPMDFVERINKLPLTFSYERLDFCHAGGNYKTFAKVQECEYNEEIIDREDAENMVWERVDLGMGWTPNRTCIFGHTPTPYLPAKYYGQDKSIENAHPCAYTSLIDEKGTGRKIDMDTGAFASGKIYVLNCLTMKAQGFLDLDINDNEIRKHDVEKIEVIQF